MSDVVSLIRHLGYFAQGDGALCPLRTRLSDLATTAPLPTPLARPSRRHSRLSSIVSMRWHFLPGAAPQSWRSSSGQPKLQRRRDAHGFPNLSFEQEHCPPLPSTAESDSCSPPNSVKTQHLSSSAPAASQQSTRQTALSPSIFHKVVFVKFSIFLMGRLAVSVPAGEPRALRRGFSHLLLLLLSQVLHV
jgi:hypothetical protein